MRTQITHTVIHLITTFLAGKDNTICTIGLSHNMSPSWNCHWNHSVEALQNESNDFVDANLSWEGGNMHWLHHQCFYPLHPGCCLAQHHHPAGPCEWLVAGQMSVCWSSSKQDQGAYDQAEKRTSTISTINLLGSFGEAFQWNVMFSDMPPSIACHRFLAWRGFAL